ncbi:heme o synthase [Oceanobacillus alkalisoli]|uniref:heme o synthase n=1 Tax=Oceanobacillus alkalisoli TaxID=2925113 RepID=UPI0021034E59|nr:heme o synthase [Oceanobacillus alkalisoli]
MLDVTEKLQANKKQTFLTDIKLLIKFKVMIANVLPVIAGLWLVMQFEDIPLSGNWGVVLLTISGSTLVIIGALVINNWYDTDIDTVMDRTKSRPTVTGNIPLTTVLFIGWGVSTLGFILLFFTNWEVMIYSILGWFIYVFPYTMWTKRKFTWNTIIGSISGAVTPLIGWTVFATGWHIVPITYALILFFWQMPHTYVIAIRKFKEYKAAGVAMLPVVKGMQVTKRMMLIYCLCLLPLPFMLHSLGSFYVAVVTILTIIWVILIIRGFFVKDDLKWAQQNFLFSVNYLLIVFLLAMIVTV